MKKVLIVQSQKCLHRTLVSQIIAVTSLTVHIARSLEEAEELMVDNAYFLMLLDMDLPFTTKDEIITFMDENQTPVIIMADVIDSELKGKLQRNLVVEYVVKESLEVIRYIVKSIHRIYKNRSTKVLVVDDSDSDRTLMSMMARQQLYQVYEAKDGEEALRILKTDAQIKIIVADIHMPKMDGIALLKYIRESKLQNELAILGVSSDKESLMRFLQLGANEFVAKPFSKVEFVTRLNHLSDVYDQIKELDELSSMDYLTQLRSRKFFFEEATPYIYNAYKSKKEFAVAMIDIDNFKQINDTHGHSVGDIVLQRLAKILHDSLKGSDIVARYGGEEFCVLLRDTDRESSYKVFENLREKIEKEVIRIVAIPRGKEISFTVSIGVSTEVKYSLEKMLTRADVMLYEAKKTGKNKVLTTPVFELEEVV